MLSFVTDPAAESAYRLTRLRSARKLSDDAPTAVLPKVCGGATPAPLNFTSCRPVVSLPLISHAPLAGPATGGADETVFVNVSPGVVVVPLENVLVARVAPPLGGVGFGAGAFGPPRVLTVDHVRGSVP